MRQMLVKLLQNSVKWQMFRHNSQDEITQKMYSYYYFKQELTGFVFVIRIL